MTEDVIELLLGQHMQIRDLFAEVENTTGEQRQDAFARLVRLLAVHETAEEQVVHPLARTVLDGGDGVVDERLHEEHEAKELLSKLEEIGPDHGDFPAMLRQLRDSVLLHAHREENYEFRYLREHYEPARLQALATAVRAAEKTAPTHPHPGVETMTENVVAGPVLSLFDRVKDAVSKVMSSSDGDTDRRSASRPEDGDVVDLIMQDHREVERLFDELKSAPEKRPLLVPVLAMILTAHSRAEEAEVYPVAREKAGQPDEIAHSQREHLEVERLLARLTRTSPQSKKFEQVLDRLIKSVTHHVQEEESTVLPGMRERLSHSARMKLARQFARSRREHMGEVPGEARKDHLVTQAHNAGLTVRSSASKDELARLLAGRKG
ncbi:hemerythrin domain-containing protein [Kibdelosporangium persicum]|uniref:Hemerythrin HHE cation binding domain-containing protein n=1 Tax=Kibdelosporangium persicum TaxID=2698649 RepID=A0ABX2F7A9_9PSEU|nr:hemerythrin domain-containing protein [Kibdelosporangium persicum]NRN66845.1 Hemerythrin HHE cation binding domain-containing protein [Kibdelosporangium persicum]